MAAELTHLDERGLPRMVDVGGKPVTARMARAECFVEFPAVAWQQLEQQRWVGAKGSIVQTAIIAGVQAAKRTADWIPFCHPLALSHVGIEISTQPGARLRIECTARCHASTGVEMEALTGASAAALTVYDMCKALTSELQVNGLRLLEKRGGKQDLVRP